MSGVGRAGWLKMLGGDKHKKLHMLLHTALARLGCDISGMYRAAVLPGVLCVGRAAYQAFHLSFNMQIIYHRNAPVGSTMPSATSGPYYCHSFFSCCIPHRRSIHHDIDRHTFR